MQAEYIRKQDAVDETKRYLLSSGVTNQSMWNECVKTIAETLEELEPADVVPVVHSRWKYKCGEIQCPECGNKIHRIDLSGFLNFCPNCGANMDEKGEK